MKYVLAIIGIGAIVTSVLLSIPREQEHKDAVSELERFGVEIRGAIRVLKETDDKAHAIAILQYQADLVAESVESFRAKGH